MEQEILSPFGFSDLHEKLAVARIDHLVSSEDVVRLAGAPH
jgi:hypothetical protein